MRVRTPARRHYSEVILVLQGGGALGAYQAGVFEGMAQTDYAPSWVTGVSIGAINASLIAGNPPRRRVERLREFWDLASSGLLARAPTTCDPLHRAFNRASAAISAFAGVPGFYMPRVPPAAFLPGAKPDVLSFYDASLLKRTLEQLVDFDLVNRGTVRLSVGAANVCTGNSTYFDSRKRRIGPEHVMASGALPPAFAAVEIDGEYYWDGGIVSNSPLWYVLDDAPRLKSLILQVDLFSARGELPRDLDQVMERHKDIIYSSKTRFNTARATELQRLRSALRQVIEKVPPGLKTEADLATLEELCCNPHIDIVHLINRRSSYSSAYKDNEFSRATVRELWQAGLEDVRRSLCHPEWLMRTELTEGIQVYDLTREPQTVEQT